CDGIVDEVLATDHGCDPRTPARIEYSSDVLNCGACRNACDITVALSCVRRQCVCEPGTTPCTEGTSPRCCPGVGCVDLDENEEHCGACGHRCGVGEQCIGGRCVCGSASGAVAMGEACPEAPGHTGPEEHRCCEEGSMSSRCVHVLGSELAHCGGCGIPCDPPNATGRCNAGVCEIESCEPNWADCNGNVADGCETPIDTNENCGACGAACGMGESCDAATLRCTCGPSVGAPRAGRVCSATQLCCPTSGGCVEAGTDENNCGGCGARCASDEICSGGRCTCHMTQGGMGAGEVCVGATPTCCPNVGCVNLATDPMHCGACGDPCATGERCAASTCGPICGNRIITMGEQCDDGNVAPGDGCSASCQIETGWTCSSMPSVCMPRCGDGLIVGSEGCDDGNEVNNDGCSASCQFEMGWTCTNRPTMIPATVCMPDCGDGRIVTGEQCDDANEMNGDGCSASCQVEAGWTCSTSPPMPTVCNPVCGDGRVVGAEMCDDGNTQPCGTCSADCRTVQDGGDCPDGTGCMRDDDCEDNDCRGSSPGSPGTCR
ncbi:MAG TPA: DUF4215 domain-containing protein, partial [Sandaracinaceae bacterium]